jgi:hypothetical protein
MKNDRAIVEKLNAFRFFIRDAAEIENVGNRMKTPQGKSKLCANFQLVSLKDVIIE